MSKEIEELARKYIKRGGRDNPFRLCLLAVSELIRKNPKQTSVYVDFYSEIENLFQILEKEWTEKDKDSYSIDPSSDEPAMFKMDEEYRLETYTIEMLLGEKVLFSKSGLSELEKDIFIKNINVDSKDENGFVYIGMPSKDGVYMPYEWFRLSIFKITKNN